MTEWNAKEKKKNRKRTDECDEKFPFSCIISDSFNTCALRTDPPLLRLPFLPFRICWYNQKMTSNLLESTNNNFHRRNCEYFWNRNLSRRLGRERCGVATGWIDRCKASRKVKWMRLNARKSSANIFSRQRCSSKLHTVIKCQEL